MELTVNGDKLSLDVDPRMPLLWALRDIVGMTGTKFGCGRALCGACTVHIDGEPVRSCAYPVSAYAAATSRSANRFSPNVYVSVHKNGDVDIVCHRSEMGQGIRTCLMQIIADEMEADWDRITLLQATGDPKYGDQNTDGSTSIRNHFDMLRTVGATAREMLDDAVVRHLHNVRRKPPRPEIRQRQSRLDWRRLDSQGSLTIVDVP